MTMSLSRYLLGFSVKPDYGQVFVQIFVDSSLQVLCCSTGRDGETSDENGEKSVPKDHTLSFVIIIAQSYSIKKRRRKVKKI